MTYLERLQLQAGTHLAPKNSLIDAFHPLIYRYIHLSIHLSNPPIHLSTLPSIHLFTHPFIHPSIHPSTKPLTQPPTYTSINKYIPTFIHSFIHPCIHTYNETPFNSSFFLLPLTVSLSPFHCLAFRPSMCLSAYALQPRSLR